MSDNKINWAMLIIVTLVVAVIASVATLAITGNTVKVLKTQYGPEVYTKAEIDAKLGIINWYGNLPLTLTSDMPDALVYIGGKGYDINLISASDSAATIRVSTGKVVVGSKEIREYDSGVIDGLRVAIISADETNLKLTTQLTIASAGI